MKEIFIERRDMILRIAIKSNGKLVDCFIEEDEENPYPGQIYKAVVKNIVSALKSAFLDIGVEKNAYLYLSGKFEKKGIKKGDELIVEVIKEELGDKGAKVTTAFTIPGRYSVLMTDNNETGFSSKIRDEDFKNNILKNLNKPSDVGIKIRTNAVSVSVEDINKEIEELYEAYNNIIREGSYRIKPGLLYSDGGVLARVLRDNVDDETGKIIVNNKEDYSVLQNFIKGKSDIETKIEIYDGYRSLFDFYGIEKEILYLKSSRVNLHCGGNIVIEKTEAMYVIDVNTGRNVTGDHNEKVAFTTNLEAAEECARQIRLRNLSGIIVIDFIDMHIGDNKSKVMRALQNGFEDDKNKTVIYPFTELNLIQVARRRRGKNIHEYMEEKCRECHGKGRILKLSYLYLLIKNEILRVDNENTIKDIYIELNSYYKDDVLENVLQFINEIGGKEKSVYINYSDKIEHFKVEPLIFKSQIEEVQRFKIYG